MLKYCLIASLAFVFACKSDSATTLENLPATGSGAPSEQSADPAETTNEAGSTGAETATLPIDAVTGYIDPVCQMKIAQDAEVRSSYQDVTYGFCSPACQSRFVAAPETYLAALEE